MMEGDGSSASPPLPPVDSPPPVDMVIQRLHKLGVPMHLDAKEMGLVNFVKENKSLLQVVVSVLMPGAEEAQLLGSGEGKQAWHDYKQGCREGVRWAQWLVFGGDPEKVMRAIQQETGHVRGVCGTVWGSNDIAFRCRTCENDPTCAICVSCFESGNHTNHDYSMIHTGGGCCDCGDITAWKESGFCSQHNGSGQAPSLPEALMSTFEPVMKVLLNEWGKRLRAAASFSGDLLMKLSDQVVKQVATQTSLALVEMFLSFCSCSESLLMCTGSLIACEEIGLLDLFLKSECFLPVKVLNKLHELLFKLMGNPNFKCQFAKIFIDQYPHFIREGLRQNLDSSHEGRGRESFALSSFSVQIFTVPTLTPQLVFDMKLLDMLLEALKDAFLSCSGGDGQQLASKGQAVSEFYYRIIDDIRFVMRHPEVAHYVARERLDLLRAWLHLLAFTQGMEAQRREMRNHVEEETENWLTAYYLEGQMGSIHPLLIGGAARADSVFPVHESSTQGWTVDDDVVHGHTKVGRTSMESDVSGKVGASNSLSRMDVDYEAVGAVGQGNDHFSTGGVVAPVSSRALVIPAVLLWLIAECAKLLDIWFLLDAHRETVKSSRPIVPKGGKLHRRGMILRGRGGRATLWRPSGPPLDNVYEVLETEMDSPSEGTIGERRRATQGNLGGASVLFENDSLPVKMQERREAEGGLTDWWMGAEIPNRGIDSEFVRNDRDWLEIDFDVSQQEVSFHIPLHRFLAAALQKSLEASPNLNQKEGNKRSWHCQDHLIIEKGFLLQLFPPWYQVPAFISCLLEHPLRIKVFCAQVRAGMWRKNGHSVQALCEHYNSVKWCEGSSDLDLFLLQCCAVMAPTEEFVERIVSRFGLTEYFSLFLLRPNEYETTLAQHMLAFLIRLVIERGFCGFSAAQACRRELIKRLAVSDATHSQLMKSLPPRLQESRHWQEALDLVATYYKPSGMQQGRFSLRQECWKEMDLYHPRWNARESQSAEDRYFRACKASPVIKQLPQWQKPFAPFQNLSRLATCKGVHDLLRSILFHAVFSEKLSESRAPENVLITALHLLALGLDVCSMFAYRKGLESKTSGFTSETTSSMQDTQEPPPLLNNATERVYFGGVDETNISNRQSLISLLVLLMRRYGVTEAQGVMGGESHLGSMGALIKTLLEKFSKLHNGCMYEIEALAPEILHRVSSCQDDKTELAKKIVQQPCLSEMDRKKLLARERQAAVMEKMKAAQEKFVASFQLSQEHSVTSKDTSENRSSGCKQLNGSKSLSDQCRQSPIAAACALCRDSSSSSPTSFLTFVQRSRLIEISEKGVPSWERNDRSKNIEALTSKEEVDNGSSVVDFEAQESQIRVELLNLIQMALNGEVDREGPIEVEALLEFIGDEGFSDSIEGSQSSVDARMSETTSSDSGSEDSLEEEILLSSCELAHSSPEYSGVFSCKDGARGDEDEKAKIRQSSMITVLLEYANILSRSHKNQHQQQRETENSATSQRQNSSRSHTNAMEGFPLDNVGSNDGVGVHMSSCGHAVHQECLDRYLLSLVQRYQSRTLFEGLQIVDPNQGEFLCPVCRRLANSVLPYIVESFPSSGDVASVSESGLQSPHDATSSALVSQVPQAMHLLCNAEELVWKSGFRKAVSKPLSKTLKSTFDCLFWRLYGLYFPGKASNSRHNNNRISQSLLLWDVLRYTILSVELASRMRKDAPFSNGENNLGALWKATGKGSVLSVLLRATKALQNQNRQSLLLRARGMQLIVGSICFGVSKDSIGEPSMPGSVLKILQFIDNVKEAADTCLWRRTADPILAHNPFCSLFWIVFCLPLSFPCSVEPFISLVHLFYLVCVSQIVLSMRDMILPNLAELHFSTSGSAFVQSMLENLTGIPLFEPLIDQTSLDLSGPILVTVRRFTLPFLRRCALLGKLLYDINFEESNYETVASYRFATAEKAANIINSERRQSVSDALEDLKELEVLEGKFMLPSVQAILESKDNQEIVWRWVSHLCKELGPRKLLPVPRLTMAAPFKLMDLPPLYQTLLQRYIKERCPVCSSVPEQPALCLLCGTLCCGFGRQACCSKNRQSECFRHAMSCNGGVGVFLMIKRTNILLQRCARQAYWPSPYLDSFGEEDIEMHRGKPLHLNAERYAALTAMVASHGLDHNSLVLSHTTWEAVIWG